MKFTATQTFLDGTDRYEEDQTYDADSGAVSYFVRNGWAKADGLKASAQPQDVTHDIVVESGTHGSKSSKVGN